MITDEMIELAQDKFDFAASLDGASSPYLGAELALEAVAPLIRKQLLEELAAATTDEITDEMRQKITEAYNATWGWSGHKISAAEMKASEAVITAVAPLIIAAERARIEAKMQSEGLVVVPRVATGLMSQEGIVPIGIDCTTFDAVRRSWTAMLAAAPAVKLWGE